jgi:predicted peptidase
MKSTLSIHWVIDSLIPHLQINEHLLTPGKPNYIMGLSTGAHGAALIAEQTSGLFSGCGLLSGDYDQDALPMDKIFEATYGSHAQFPLRWRNIDNPTAGISNLNIPVFLGHGASDRVIPVSQSKQFYKALEKTHPHLPHFLEVIPAAGHDWICWDSSLSSMFKFWLDGSIKQDL